MEQICNERRLFRGSLLGWGAAGTQWGVCYFGPSRAIAHKLTSFQCKCLFSAKTLNSVLVLEKTQGDLSIAYAALQSLHLFKTWICFRNQSKTARGILTRPEPTCDRVSWLPSQGATSLLPCASADKQAFKSLSPHLTFLLMVWQPLPVLHAERQVSMLLRLSPYVCGICEILLLTMESQVLKNFFRKMLVSIWPLCWVTLLTSHSLSILPDSCHSTAAGCHVVFSASKGAWVWPLNTWAGIKKVLPRGFQVSFLFHLFLLTMMRSISVC